MRDDIDFDILGIGKLIKGDTLSVPLNQRDYAWLSDVQVQLFLQDITNTMRSRNQTYFLGTIVLTLDENKNLQIADGQQRLATTTMLFAAIRDYFADKGKAKDAHSIETEYLCSYDRIKGEDVSRLTLNVDDNDFFINTVVFRKQSRKPVSCQRRSHKLILSAFQSIKEYIKLSEQQFGEAYISTYLNELIEYLKEKATVVKLVVSTEETAFTLFETLNDRGLKTSQADLVKNHIFKLSDNRLPEAQKLWSSMKGAIETISDTDDDITMEFLRASCCVIAGLTTKKEVLKKIQEKSANKSDAIHILSVLEELSREYVAILNPDHQKWNEYDDDVRSSITAMNLLGVTQIRPLMLSIAKYFNEKEAAKSFKKVVSWSVRFMVLGIRGGRLDDGYSKLAHKIYLKEIKNADQLKIEADKIVIGDAEFKSAFETASVSVAKLARYYLRSLELTAQGIPNPEFIPNDNKVINLEHIMPSALSDKWKNVTSQDIETHLNRLGNLVLLQAVKNSTLGNDSFADKSKIYKQSSFQLTNQIVGVKEWDTKAIDNRQKVLAELAVKTWPL